MLVLAVMCDFAAFTPTSERRTAVRACPKPEVKIMSSSTDISALYHEFTDALTEVLAENAVGPARRGRLARARAAVKKHPDYSESGYLLAVETAFKNWEAIQNAGR
jgi:hypothetical protein